MGEAKRRGSREQRVAEAEIRRKADEVCAERQAACSARMRARHEKTRRERERWEALFRPKKEPVKMSSRRRILNNPLVMYGLALGLVSAESISKVK